MYDTKFIKTLLKYMRKHDISDKNKEILYNIVFDLKNKTDLQKKRFVQYYGLNSHSVKKETLIKIATKENVTASAIRGSIVSIKRALINSNDDVILILKNIYEFECKK